jgi:hypothetical protein
VSLSRRDLCFRVAVEFCLQPEPVLGGSTTAFVWIEETGWSDIFSQTVVKYSGVLTSDLGYAFKVNHRRARRASLAEAASARDVTQSTVCFSLNPEGLT